MGSCEVKWQLKGELCLLNLFQQSLYRTVYGLLLNGASKDATLKFFETALKHNAKRSQMQVSCPEAAVLFDDEHANLNLHFFKHI